MYSTEQRRAAIETFIKFDHSYADTIAELGYPNRHTLNNWWREYKATGEVPIAKAIREPRFSDEQKREAVEHYLGHGKRLKRTMKALGYPKSRMTLCEWIDELAPGQRKYRGPNPKRDSVPIEKKVQVVAELEARTGPAAEIAEKHGVSRAAPYVWRREIMGDNGGEPEKKGEPVSKEYDDLPDDVGELQDMLREAKMQLRKVQLELDAFMMAQGADGLAFPTIVATGAHGSSPHAQPGDAVIEPGDAIVMDFGARKGGYCSDMTRTVFVGEPSDELREAYEVLRRANEECEALVRAGAIGAEVHAHAEEVLAAGGYAGKMGHGLGHGVGLVIHEDPVLSPRNKKPLPDGAVVTVEPGIYIPGKFGMRLEDCGLVTPDGYEPFGISTHELVVVGA